MAETALVLGATGSIGSEMAAALHRHGFQVRALHRDPAAATQRAPWLGHVQWVAGDAMRAEDVRGAASGARLIVHAVNPPGYRDWDRLVLPMLDSSIEAARASGAKIVLPGNVYNYGPDAFPCLTEASPQHPLTRKGRIRVEMERRLAASGVPALVVRAGDFFGPRAGSNWFAMGIVGAARPVRRLTDPGTAGVGHAWAWLPDLAETMCRLALRDADGFDTFHFAGHWDADGTQMLAAIRRALGDPALPVRRMPWRLLMLASPFVPFLREMREMRYLWQVPLRLDNAKLRASIGEEPHTPLQHAVQAALADAPRAAGASAGQVAATVG